MTSRAVISPDMVSGAESVISMPALARIKGTNKDCPELEKTKFSLDENAGPVLVLTANCT